MVRETLEESTRDKFTQLVEATGDVLKKVNDTPQDTVLSIKVGKITIWKDQGKEVDGDKMFDVIEVEERSIVVRDEGLYDTAVRLAEVYKEKTGQELMVIRGYY